MVKTYFLAPDFSTAPPPEGPIRLGSILRNVAEFEPLNEDVQKIPETQLYPIDKKTGFKITLRDLHSADSGLRANVLGLLAIGPDASIEWTRGSSRVISCQHLETIAFNPTEPYMIEAMNDLTVRSFMKSSKFRVSVYMVTGLKIARGASSTSSTSKTVAMKTDVGLMPPGIPAEVGLRAGYAHNTEEGEKWDASTDFIVALKVKKMWLNRHGEVQHQAHIKKAVMLSATSSSSEPEHTLQWDDDLTLQEINEMFGMGEDDI